MQYSHEVARVHNVIATQHSTEMALRIRIGVFLDNRWPESITQILECIFAHAKIIHLVLR